MNKFEGGLRFLGTRYSGVIIKEDIMRSTAFLITLAGILLALNTGHIEVLFEVGLVISVILFIWLVRVPEKNKK